MTPLREDDLHALIDGQLERARLAEVEAQIAANAEDAARARFYERLNAGLRRLYDPVLDEPVPERLLVRPKTPALRWVSYAQAAAVLLFGVALGWFGHAAWAPGTGNVASLAHQAAIAHVVYAPEVRHPVEVGADEQDHLVRWLSKRLGTELKCPRLNAYGFDLVGGRLLSGPNGPVAHFMFQDGKGARLTLYVSAQRADSGETAFRFSQENRVSVFYWIDGHFGYALSGEMGREQLLTIANAVYHQIHP